MKGPNCKPCLDLFGKVTPSEGMLVLADTATGTGKVVPCCRDCAMQLVAVLEAAEAAHGEAEAIADRITARKPSASEPLAAASDDEAVSALLGTATYNGEDC